MIMILVENTGSRPGKFSVMVVQTHECNPLTYSLHTGSWISSILRAWKKIHFFAGEETRKKIEHVFVGSGPI